MSEPKVFDINHPEKCRNQVITESFIRDCISDMHNMSEEELMEIYTQGMIHASQGDDDEYLNMMALLTVISILPTSTPAEILEFVADNGGFGRVMLRVMSNEYRNPMAKVGPGQWIEIDQIPQEDLDAATAELGDHLLDAGMDEEFVASALELRNDLAKDGTIHDENEVLEKLIDFGMQFNPNP